MNPALSTETALMFLREAVKAREDARREYVRRAASVRALLTGGVMFDPVVEQFAKLLHEANRGAVAKGQVARDDVPVYPFREWDDLTENAKEGRRTWARYLIDNASIVHRFTTSETEKITNITFGFHA